MTSILLVGDDDEANILLAEILWDRGWQVHRANDVEEAKEAVQRGLDFEIVILSRLLTNSLSSKLSLIGVVRDHHHAVPVLLLDHGGTLERRALPVSDPVKILDGASTPSEIIEALEKFVGVEDPL